MSKTTLIKRVALETGNSKANAKELVDCVLDEILTEIVEGGSLLLQGFGTFTLVDKAERVGRNPATGESMVIAPKTVLKFKASKALKLTK